MKWSLVEELPFCKADYDKEELYAQWNKYIEKRLSECAYYSFELSWKYARKEKWQIEQEQIESDLADIRPTVQNAFLFNKRLSG